VHYIEGILTRLQTLNKRIKELEDQYEDGTRIRGRAYQKKITSLRDQVNSTLLKLKHLGTNGTLSVVICEDDQGYHYRTHFINLDYKAIKAIFPLKYPKYNLLSITEIVPGELSEI